MKLKTLATAVAVSSLTLATPVMAESKSATSPEMKRGAVSGMVIGAITGGPLGAFAGTVLGGEVFGRLIEQHRVNGDLKQQVASLDRQLKAEQKNAGNLVAMLNSDLDKVIEMQAALPKKRVLPVQFRTASDELESQYVPELTQVARVLRRNRDATVTLSGFSDRRGDEALNQALSEARVTAVKTFLLEQGVSGSQVIAMAYGESRPVDPQESLEGNFFDRRVVVELSLDIDPQLATR